MDRQGRINELRLPRVDVAHEVARVHALVLVDEGLEEGEDTELVVALPGTLDAAGGQVAGELGGGQAVQGGGVLGARRRARFLLVRGR